jgi:hypothetical protein
MPSHTLFEQSDPVTSPSGLYSVAVSSQTSLPNEGLSQAVVSEPNGGSGLIAFYSPRVAMEFVWNSDDELVVRYPKEQPAPRIDATNSSFGLGGRGRVIYEAVPRSALPPLRWTAEGELRTVTEEPLERGVLLTFDTGDRREYSYSYYDAAEPDSSSNALQAQGFQGGGESWAGIAHGLIALSAPEFMNDIELDPEADGLSVRSTNRAALMKLARLIATAKKDPALFAAAVERASLDGQME